MVAEVALDAAEFVAKASSFAVLVPDATNYGARQ
jgi:hypothetical protein